jgi:hypothetical protein
MLPLGAFKQRGSVVGGRSMRLHGGGYEPTEEDMRLMDIYYAAMDAGLSQKEAEKVQMQAAMEATYGAPQVSVDTAGLTGAAPNIQGTPTLYYDPNGNLAGVLSQNGVVTPASMNALIPNFSSTVATANTPVQMVDAEGVRLYLRDANDPESVTYTNTGIPAIAGTLGESAYRPVEDRGILGTIGSDFAGMAKDPAFWKFLASAAAITGGGLAINAAIGAPAAAGATGGMSAAEAIAAAAQGGLGAEFGVQGALGGLSGLGAPAAAGGMSAAEAIAAAAEGGLGAEFGVQGALAANPSWLAAIEAALPAGAMGSLVKGGLTLGGLAALSALAPKQGGGGSTGGTPSLSADQLKAIVSSMPSAMGNYISMAGNPFGYGGGTIDSANANLANLFPGFSLPTAGPYFGAGRFGDAYAPQALPTAPISPTGLV